jgi:GT2 family glycosyltransferase
LSGTPGTSVGVVVLNYNGGAMTLRCLEALQKTTWAAGTYRVVLVDNASTDGVADEVARRWPSVDIVRSPVNRGFAGGCNLGIVRLAAVDFVALLNNDAEPEPGWLDALHAALESDGGYGAATAKIVLAADAGIINNTGTILRADGYGADRGLYERDQGQYDTRDEVFAWSGGAAMLRKAYLDDVGLFDERLFLYYEDFDLAWRGRLRGWRYVYAPDAVVHHVHAATSVEGSPLFTYYVERNRLLVLFKNAPAGFALSALWRFVLITGSYARSDMATARRRVRALLGFARKVPRTLVERRHVRRGRRATDAAILSWRVDA